MRAVPTAGEIAARICSVVRRQAGEGERDIALHEPRFAGNEWEYVKRCIDTGWVSSAGNYVDELERRLGEYTGARRAIVTVNGTAALHVALRLAGVEAGDEVLVPALTFVATANAVSYCGAVPHFVESEERSLGLNPGALSRYLSEIGEQTDEGLKNRETGRRIRAVVPMHTFGHPVDLDGLDSVCERFGLPMVEDAAESLGSLYRGEHTGTRGRLGVLSFNGNKIITTGGGGAILTDDEELAARAKHLTTTAKKDHPWAYEHDRIGYNYRMPNINAALGCAQLEELPGFLERKRRLASRYEEAFEDIGGVTFVKEPDYGRSNYWLNALLLDEQLADRRDEILESTNDAGVHTRPAWRLMPRLPMYADSPSMPLPCAESLERRLVDLPSSAVLGGEPS